MLKQIRSHAVNFMFLLALGGLVVAGCDDDTQSLYDIDTGSEPDDTQTDEVDTQTEDTQETDDLGDTQTDTQVQYWSEQVDEFWGEAPDVDARLEFFDAMWDTFAANYGAFVTSEVDWDEVNATMRPRIESASSYGQFFAILSEINQMLHDTHTSMESEKVCRTSLEERPPIFLRKALTSMIGACITVLDDDTLLVYRVEDGNPAGLEPGDIVVGYDGKNWRDLLEKFNHWNLPVCSIAGYAPNNRSNDLRAMGSVLNNGHLFNNLDVIKYGSTDIEQISTQGLISSRSNLVCSDQMPIDGIDLPWTDLAVAVDDVSWGILDGTNIGYIYAYSWGAEVEQPFLDAITDLMETDGLIIDFRFNLGGSSTVALDGLALLFDEDQVNVYNGWTRDASKPDDYNAMVSFNEGAYDIIADQTTFYNKPIALLSGPKAGSAGDGVTHLVSLHPRVRRFGRATSGGFGFYRSLWDPTDPFLNDIGTKYTPGILSDADGNWLHAAEQSIDEEVWLKQEDVVAGIDSVVEAALDWIEAQSEN